MILSVFEYIDYYAIGYEGQPKTFIPKCKILHNLDYFLLDSKNDTYRTLKIDKTLEECFIK